MKQKIIFFILLHYIFAVDYYNQIQPIFNANCTDCHVGNFASGGLDLTNYENLMDGGNSGQVVVPGDHTNSILWQRIDSGDMPSGADRLNQEDIDLIAEWIDGGAGRCDEGFSYYENVEEEYNNINIQDDGLCFNDGDLEALTDIIIVNNFDSSMNAFELGTQTWNEGRLRFLVAGYYFSGVEEPIHTIPESISNLNDLRKLYLEWNQITELPNTFTSLTALVQLYISNNQLISLPENFGDLNNLYILDLGYNQITQLPNSIINLNGLGYLWLFNNQLTELPENFCTLNLDWDGDDYFGYPYFAIGGNMLCEDLPECVANSDHLNTSLEQYYYSVQITVEQDCDWLDLNDNNINLTFGIKNIYPNPFNPVTNIDFILDQSEQISISIFDIKGNKINTLIDKELFPIGYNSIEWNAQGTPSGIYFVTIENQLKTQTQKIILQK